jgi:uncharacterized membrane protein
MNGLVRILKHLSYPDWWLHRTFTRDALDRIAKAVAASEAGHGAEIRVAIETRIGLLSLLNGQSARKRAEEVFSQLRVWDTEANNGVLIYVLLAERRFEIVADRAISRVVPQDEWEGLCREMGELLCSGRQEAAVVRGIEVIGTRFAALFPRSSNDVNELPDRPAVL